MKVYLANGLFSLGDRLVNKEIAKALRDSYYVDLFVPQEQPFNDKSTYADSITIAEGDIQALMESDVLVAVIDGAEIDSGVACEIGMFYSTGRPIFALYTDVRQQGRSNIDKINALMEDGTENQFMYRNLFVIGAIKKRGKVYENIEDLVKGLGRHLNLPNRFIHLVRSDLVSGLGHF